MKNEIVNEQKFKRGNRVKVADDYSNIIYISGDRELPKHESAGKEAFIIGSYADQFGGSDYSKYTLMFKDGSTCSWFPESELSLIDEGGEHLIEEAQKKFQEEEKLHRDIKYITTQWRNNLPISSTMFLTLFEKIGFNSVFLRNGEYYCLFEDARQAKPLFDALFKAEKFSEIEEVLNCYNSEFIKHSKEKIRILFEEISKP